MFDVNDDAKDGYRRVEMLTGPGRRRRWSLEAKARVVVESFAPGAGVSKVARRWQVCPQQVFAWRREARAGLLALPSEAATGTGRVPDFVPILAEPALLSAQPASAPAKTSVSTIEVELAGAVIRVLPGMDDALLMTVLRAVRVSVAAA